MGNWGTGRLRVMNALNEGIELTQKWFYGDPPVDLKAWAGRTRRAVKGQAVQLDKLRRGIR